MIIRMSNEEFGHHEYETAKIIIGKDDCISMDGITHKYVTNADGLKVDYDAAVALMDYEICEELHDEIAPYTDQEFFDAYCKAHAERFGEEFAPNTNHAW